MSTNDPHITMTADKPTKISVVLNASLLAVAVSACAMLYGIRNRQELMEQRQAYAQERTGDQLERVSGDIKELTTALRDGLAAGNEERGLIGGRVNQLEKDFLRLENRVSNLEQ